MELTWLILELLGVGLLAGILGGMLGVGGGIVMIPSLTFLLGDAYGRDSFHAYNLAAISTAIVLSIPAAVRHTRARAVVYPLLPSILPLALVGVIAGVWLGSQLVGERTRTLKQVFGLFLELVVAISLFQDWRAQRGEPHLCSACPMPQRRGLIGLLVGLPSGVIAGLLGVGGGIWAVPAQTLVLGVRLRNAIATSTVMIIAVAIVTSAGMTWKLTRLDGVHNLPGIAWLLTLGLAPGAVVGGWIGAGLAHKLPVRALRYVFLVLLALTGVRLVVA